MRTLGDGRSKLIVVASHGRFDNLHLDEAIRIGRCKRLANRIAAMADLATRRMNGEDEALAGKPDDLTVLMFTPS